MPEAAFNDSQMPSPDDRQRPFVLINSFTPKPGKIDELAAVLAATRDRFSDRVPGFFGGRIYRDTDGGSALQISVFETQDHYESWIVTDEFAEHRALIASLTDGVGQSRIATAQARTTCRRAANDL